ncbi:polysaccharide biosynthesis tyrosine autokinase [Pseudaminobacter soli (ex Li et al. 2025)]|uniref:ATPase n=1 Tax=Pseudaminobacter soli (ex Li et al. 2025) TaxID=1295366 RepID=A0A2P7S7T4_9HYPH|nr:Wzz/FepE/Etk N-terminal domain-containing protein [Mesorhizobium soli]PSJ58542.1 ATPase [Mesorhizobium soli]
MDRRLPTSWQSAFDRGAKPEGDFVGLADIALFLRQYLRTILGFILCALFLGWFYIATTDPVYTAQTQLLIEPKMPQLLQQQAELNLTLDTAQIESQIAVMQSEKIATMVINQLKLKDDPVFNRSQNLGLLERVKKLAERWGLSRFPHADDLKSLSDFQRDRMTMGAYTAGLDVRRVGVSYAIAISFRALDPETAANVANATADAFVREQLEMKFTSAREGGNWLEQRLNELRTQMNAATKIEQEFRAKHDYGVGDESSNGSGGEASTNAPTLEELEVTANTYRKMYESFLQAYTNSVSQQSYPVADARVITKATRPLVASDPRRKLVYAFAGLGGLMLGLGVAFLRLTLDRSIRSPQQLREDFGLECIGELPPIPARGAKLDAITTLPASKYSVGLRRVKTAIDLHDPGRPLKCIGVASSLPSDGKSSFASNLAMLHSMCGDRVLVIDTDIFHSVLSQGLLGAVDPDQAAGWSIFDNIAQSSNGRVHILSSSVVDAKNLLTPRNLRAVLPELQGYDMIIVDLPPLTVGADRLAIATCLDGVLLVSEWGATPSDLFGELVRTMHASKTLVIGAVMTNVRSARAKNGSRRRQTAR